MKETMESQFVDSIFAAFREGDAHSDEKLEEAENIRLVEKVYGIIARGDFAALSNVMSDDVVLEIISPPDFPFTGNHQGIDQVIETTRRNFSKVEGQRPEILSVVAQGDTVVVVGKERGRFCQTGRDYELHWMQQFTFRGGKLARVRELFDSASVLKAAGLAE